jgi:hypothetical protein
VKSKKNITIIALNKQSIYKIHGLYESISSN